MKTSTPSPVPLLDLTVQFQSIRDEVMGVVEDVLSSGGYILGPQVDGFELEVGRYLGAAHAVGVANGSDALVLALMALGVGSGDRVIVPAYSFVATATAVERVGARLLFTDIEPTTFNMRPDSLERCLENPGVRAVIPVHLFGQCASMDRIVEQAERKGLSIIEDAAQAIGARFDDRKAGTMGSVGCFSFFPTKNLGACGDAGLCTARDETVANTLRRLRVHGAGSKYVHELLGFNSRLDALQAAILAVKLKHLDTWSSARIERARIYRRLFQQAGVLAAEPTRPGPHEICLPVEAPRSPSVYHQFVVRVHADRRDSLVEHLRSREIGCAIYYPLPLHRQPCLRSDVSESPPMPEAERATRETLALPIYPELTLAQQERVVGQVTGFLAR